MSRVRLAVRVLVARRAKYLCEYCQSAEELTGHDFFLDHIEPEATGGSNDACNLAWSCFWCNNFKQARSQAIDPRTGKTVRLFNPRIDDWSVHFRWSKDKLTVIGRSATGRATVEALKMNRPTLLRGRRCWVRSGKHPPPLGIVSEE